MKITEQCAIACKTLPVAGGVMKMRMVALIFFCASVAAAQSTADNKPRASNQPETKAACSCCQNTAATKDAGSCCDQHANTAAQSGSCCMRNETMACMKGDKDKSADATCGHGRACGAGQEGCCRKSEKGSDQAAMACCTGSAGHCGMHSHEDTK
jgi:hypothetical protein